MALFPRNVEPEVEAALADTPVVVIVGPRQCGKSTLAERIADSHGARKVSLDDAGTRAAANADPTSFIEDSELPLLIDEFQKAPALLDAIKRRVDRARQGGSRAAGMFLLTGSANVWSTLRISESLTGRAERIQLWPLSQGELRGRREDFLAGLLAGRVPRLGDQPIGRKPIVEAIARGGYPEMVARSQPDRRARWLQNYLEMILERDARDIAERGRQLDELPRLLRIAATRVAGLTDLTAMGRAIEMKRDSTRRYLRLLELLFLVRQVPAWSGSLAQQTIKTPKLWIPDSGLACGLVGYGEERLLEDEAPHAGALFENFVAAEVLKQSTWLGQAVGFHHFRTPGGREVDIVVELADGSLAGIEAKLGATPSKSDFSGLAHLRDKLGDRFKAGVVIHTGAETLPFGDRLWAVPVAGIWSAAGDAGIA